MRPVLGKFQIQFLKGKVAFEVLIILVRESLPEGSKKVTQVKSPVRMLVAFNRRHALEPTCSTTVIERRKALS
jgi:hypothetical protein